MTSSDTSRPKLELSDDEWRKKLNPQEFQVLRRAGTERPFVGEYTDTKTQGIYQCRACGTELFRSTEKFDSHCGWPSFFDPSSSDAVILRPDHSMGTTRTEVLCANCHSHLGHVFSGEGYPTPTDQRYCINSISLRLVPTAPSGPARRDTDTTHTTRRCGCAWNQSGRRVGDGDASRPTALVHPSGVHFPERRVHPAVDQPRLHRPVPLQQFLRLLGHVGVARGHHLDRLGADVDLVGGRAPDR